MKKRGVGVGSMWYGIGNTGLPNPAGAFVEVHSDASVTVLTGCADIGQGSTTALAQIVAEVLGLEFDDVNINSGDTGVSPEAGATSASRQTYISGNACALAAQMAKDILLKVAADMMDVNIERVDLKNKKAIVIDDDSLTLEYSELMGEMKKRGLIAVGSGSFNPPTSGLEPINMQGVPYATYAFATQVVEVEVDTYTGEVEILKIVAAHDVGHAINKSMVEGQIEGGAMMGAGYALLEKIEVKEGRITNPSFSKYLIYTVKDMPEIYPVIVEDPTSTGPFGAKGVGEPALIPTAPAILGAIHDAIGIQFTEVPVTARDIVKALKEKNRGKVNE